MDRGIFWDFLTVIRITVSIYSSKGYTFPNIKLKIKTIKPSLCAKHFIKCGIAGESLNVIGTNGSSKV
jgi:hypothetical protein